MSTRFSVQYIVAAAGHAMEEVRVAWPEEVRRATVAVKRVAGWLASSSARAKALEEAEAAVAMAHTDVELAAVAKAFADEGEALLKVILDTLKEVLKRRSDEAAAERHRV